MLWELDFIFLRFEVEAKQIVKGKMKWRRTREGRERMQRRLTSRIKIEGHR